MNSKIFSESIFNILTAFKFFVTQILSNSMETFVWKDKSSIFLLQFGSSFNTFQTIYLVHIQFVGNLFQNTRLVQV